MEKDYTMRQVYCPDSRMKLTEAQGKSCVSEKFTHCLLGEEKPMHKLFKRRNFTLIELLVVITIIAILITLLLPVLQKSKESGRRSVCAGNQRQISIGIFTYLSDYNYLPPYNSGGPNYVDRIPGQFYTNILSDNGYVPVRDSEWGVKEWEDRSCGSVHRGIWRCPSVRDSQLCWGGGYGVVTSAETLKPAHVTHLFDFGKSGSIHKLKRLSSIMLLADTADLVDNETIFSIWCPKCFSGTWTTAQEHVFADRHFGGGNWIAFDGHLTFSKWHDIASNQDDVFGHSSP
jgi:prepilin-type N-terminal cleavage/methylation domain-containing protein